MMNENAGQSVAGEREALPADFICPACGYDLSGASVERCSECGLEIDHGVRDAHEARREYCASKGWRRDFCIGLSPIAIGAAAVLGRTSVFELLSLEVLFNVLAYATNMMIALMPGLFSGAIYATRFPRRMRLPWFGALVAMQIVAQLPIMSLMLAQVILSRAGAVSNGLGVIGAIVLPLAMFVGLLFVTRLWKLMWRCNVRRAGLILNRRIDRHVHLISIISLTPSLLVFLFGILQVIHVLFFSD